jgi:MoxR-like ATPase
MRQILHRLVRRTTDASHKALRDGLAQALVEVETSYVPFRKSEGPSDAWASYQGPRRAVPGKTAFMADPDARQPEPRTRLPDSLSWQLPPAELPAPILPDNVTAELGQIVAEYWATDRLAANGLAPTSKVLLTGAPGTGKTHSAWWLAAALGKPLINLSLPQMIAHELGRSARNLQAAMEAGAAEDAVLFIDELDAIGRSRVEALEVGEMKRLVNVLLLELDRWPPGRLLIAATNHLDLLDTAVTRRFEKRIDLPLPEQPAREALLDLYLGGRLTGNDAAGVLRAVASISAGASASGLRELALQARRQAALSEQPLSEVLLTLALAAHPSIDAATRDAVVEELAQMHLSQRRIGQLMGITHPTVGAILKRRQAGSR